MPRVRFTRKAGWYTAKAVQLPGEMSYDVEEFDAGDVRDLPANQAQSFVNQGAADFVVDESAAAATPEPPVLSIEGEEAAPAGSSDPAAPPPAPSAAPPKPPKKPR